MAHELTMNNGIAEMAYIGDTPWHGLGQRLTDDASMGQWRVAAGMEWEVKSSPVIYQTPGLDQLTLQHPSQRVLYRSDNGNALGVVSNKYKEVQPADVLDFFNELVERDGFKMETAGTLFGGRKFWALASVGEHQYVGGKMDEMGGYVLLSTACDGSMSTQARFTTVRVVCNNTLSMAVSEDSANMVSVPHSSIFCPKSAKMELGIANEEFENFMKAATSLSQVEVAKLQAELFVEELLQECGFTHKEIRKSPAYSNVIDLFEGKGKGANMGTANGTMWGLVNSVTEYYDHHVKANSQSNRLNSAWFGKGNKVKSRAFQKALLAA